MAQVALFSVINWPCFRLTKTTTTRDYVDVSFIYACYLPLSTAAIAITLMVALLLLMPMLYSDLPQIGLGDFMGFLST